MNYLIDFCEKFDFLKEARESLIKDYRAIIEHETAREIFSLYVLKYDNDELTDYYGAVAEMDKVAEFTGVHEYAVKLLFCISLSKKLKIKYIENKLSEEIFYNTMLDLKWKLLECYKMYGIWGSFVTGWFREYFTLERFALGRLQFEIFTVKEARDNGNISVKAGDKLVNVHIPSSGKLVHEDCIESYKQAYGFFREYQRNGIMIFCCHSWLLHPNLFEILPENSNILTFQKDFDIVMVDDRDVFTEGWRIFNCDCEKCEIKDYPEDTSLQRSIKKYLLSGKKLGFGFGAFKFDGEKVCRK